MCSKRTRIRHSERYEGRSEGEERVAPIGDPLQAAHTALTTQRATVTSPGGSVTIESGADGRIHAIRLNDRARRADPDELAATIAQVHNAALNQARTAVTDTIARLESDPHIPGRASHDRCGAQRDVSLNSQFALCWDQGVCCRGGGPAREGGGLAGPERSRLAPLRRLVARPLCRRSKRRNPRLGRIRPEPEPADSAQIIWNCVRKSNQDYAT